VARQGSGAIAAYDRLTSGLGWLTLALAVGAFVVVEVLLMAAAWRLRQPPEPESDRRSFRLSWRWELLWTLLPAVGLLALGLLSAQALFDRPAPVSPNAPTPVGMAAQPTAPTSPAHTDPGRGG
jgi:heme/copper-type cytochrome/quinol oxidase subunit 2